MLADGRKGETMNANVLFNQSLDVISTLTAITEQDAQTIETLGIREQYRDQYWQRRDPIYEDRLLWRAHTFRHVVHLLPGQTILELGVGQGLFTQQLLRISREENPITAVTFNATNSRPEGLSSS